MLRMHSFCAGLLVVPLAIIMGGCSSSTLPISVSLSSSSPTTIDQGQTVGITAIVTNDMLSKGVSWSLTGPGSLSNSTGSSATYNPPTTSILSSAQRAVVTATSLADQTKRASLPITVNPLLQIPLLQFLPNGSVGSPYSQKISLTGGTAPFQWSIYNGPIDTGWRVGGSLPDGLKLDADTGTISGTPTSGGTWYFEATVTDAAGAFGFGPLSIQVNSTAPPGNPVPLLNQPLVPTATSLGSDSFTLSVSGTGFVSGATIDFNNSPLATTFVDSEHLSAMVPAADVVKAGTAPVTVVNPAPGGGRSNAVYFQMEAPQGSVNFANAANSPMQIPEPFGIQTGDFNEDGKPDLIITGNVRLYVFLGDGDGTFAPAAGSPMNVPSPPYDDFGSPYTGPIAVGDFNKSGHLGLAVGMYQNEAAAIFLGKGDGTFVSSSAAFAYALGDWTFAIEAADFNADGNLDLAIANELNGQRPVVLGYGTGRSARRETSAPGYCQQAWRWGTSTETESWMLLSPVVDRPFIRTRE